MEGVKISEEFFDLFDEKDDNEYKSTKFFSEIKIPTFSFTRYNPFMKENQKENEKSSSYSTTFSYENKGRELLPVNFKKQTHNLVDLSQFTCVMTPKFCFNSEKTNSSLSIGKELPDHYKMRIEENDELNEFFDHKLIEDLNKIKSEFDTLDLDVFRTSRNSTNPYEKIKNSVFQNRAAVKMANIDHIAEFCKIPLLEEEKGKIFFADICSGPGGFTEYMYWRFKPKGCKGWGFTLKGKDDYRIDKFNPDAKCDGFELCYGLDHTGDIYVNDNMKYLAKEIDNATEGRGVGLVMADGGFPIGNQYDKQEVLSKQIILCQFLTGIYCLRKGGNFMCKIFDMYHQFTNDLVYVLYQCFEKVTIVKPYTSRVANSERYVIGINLLERRPKICEYLFRVNDRFNKKENVISIVNQEFILNDKNFFNYIRDSITKIGESQKEYLKFIKYAVEDVNFRESFRDVQMELATSCLKEWNLPLESSFPYRRNRGYRRGFTRGRNSRYYQPRERRYTPRNERSFQQKQQPRPVERKMSTGNEWEDTADDEYDRLYAPAPKTSMFAPPPPKPYYERKRERERDDNMGGREKKVTKTDEMKSVHDGGPIKNNVLDISSLFKKKYQDDEEDFEAMYQKK